MHGISQFYDKFFDKSPFKNVKEPAKPQPEQKETPMSESEKKRMHATQSVTDKSIKEQDYPGQHGVIIGKGAPEMSPFNEETSQDTGITTPSYTGGYVGGGDIEGGYYVSTADMTKKIGETLNKVGNAIGGAIEGAGKGKIGPGVADDAVDDATDSGGKNVFENLGIKTGIPGQPGSN
jgi:hypothetical protein